MWHEWRGWPTATVICRLEIKWSKGSLNDLLSHQKQGHRSDSSWLQCSPVALIASNPKWSAFSEGAIQPIHWSKWNALNIGLVLHGWYKQHKAIQKLTPSRSGSCQINRGINYFVGSSHSSKSMSSSDGSSIEAKIIPINERRADTEGLTSDSEASCSSEELRQRCVIKVTVETRPRPLNREVLQ